VPGDGTIVEAWIPALDEAEQLLPELAVR